MITVSYNGNKQKLIDAVAKANSLLATDTFYQDIASHPNFDMSDATPQIISDLMRRSDVVMRLVPYISLHRSVYGYDDPMNPDLIHVNLFRNDWSIGGLVNTIIHEAVHAVNNQNPQYDFGHGDNKSVGKQNTAPYWIGNHAEAMIEGVAAIVKPMEHEPHPEYQV